MQSGYAVVESYLDGHRCREYLEMIEQYRTEHPLPEIVRPGRPRPLRYKVIDGNAIREHLPAIWDLYQGPIQALVQQSVGSHLEPLRNERAGVNVNVMAPNRSEYRWHYDRNVATAILYLNTVEGGETEFYPNYRLLLPGLNSLRVQRILDRAIHLEPVRAVFSRKVSVRPEEGRLLLMRGNRCWHSVRGVSGTRERINLILAYDSPTAQHKMQTSLDADLYSREAHRFNDPNYGM